MSWVTGVPREPCTKEFPASNNVMLRWEDLDNICAKPEMAVKRFDTHKWGDGAKEEASLIILPYGI